MAALRSEPWYVIAAAIVIRLPWQAGEEIGWRGMPFRDSPHTSDLRARVLLLGLSGELASARSSVQGRHYGQSFPLFVAGGIALSVAMTWLYVNTKEPVARDADALGGESNYGPCPDALANPGRPLAWTHRS